MTEDNVMSWRISAGKREVTVELHHKGEPLGHYVFTSRDELQTFVARLERAAFEGFGMDGWVGVGGAGLASNFVPRGGVGSHPAAHARPPGDSVCIGYGPVVYAGPNGIAGGSGYGSGGNVNSNSIGINAGSAGVSNAKSPPPAKEAGQ